MPSREQGPAVSELARAVQLFARIRRDGEWEAAQTHESLLPYLVEETWELVDCVTDGPDRDELVSELGDLLLQVLFHSAIGAERDDRPFDVDDVAAAMLAKLRRRAPYWFADEGCSGESTDGPTAAEQDRLWQEAKRAERERGGARRDEETVFEGVSWNQPALALGQKVLARASSAGVPDELVPAELRCVHVGPGAVFGDYDSPEIAYRAAVRRFAARVHRAVVEAGRVPADAAGWRAVWGSV